MKKPIHTKPQHFYDTTKYREGTRVIHKGYLISGEVVAVYPGTRLVVWDIYTENLGKKSWSNLNYLKKEPKPNNKTK